MMRSVLADRKAQALVSAGLPDGPCHSPALRLYLSMRPGLTLRRGKETKGQGPLQSRGSSPKESPSPATAAGFLHSCLGCSAHQPAPWSLAHSLFGRSPECPLWPPPRASQLGRCSRHSGHLSSHPVPAYLVYLDKGYLRPWQQTVGSKGCYSDGR